MLWFNVSQIQLALKYSFQNVYYANTHILALQIIVRKRNQLYLQSKVFVCFKTFKYNFKSKINYNCFS